MTVVLPGVPLLMPKPKAPFSASLACKLPETVLLAFIRLAWVSATNVSVTVMVGRVPISGASLAPVNSTRRVCKPVWASVPLSVAVTVKFSAKLPTGRALTADATGTNAYCPVLLLTCSVP